MKKDKAKKIDESSKRLKELEEGWKRTQADFDNYRKRVEESRGETTNLIKAEFLSRLAPVLDNFRRAFAHAPDDDFSRGVKQIEKQLEDILTSEGLEKITVEENTKFDHNLHEAVTFEENDTIASDHIISELESGWKFNGRVIKPAKVRVSKGK